MSDEKAFKLSDRTTEFIVWAKQLDNEPHLKDYRPLVAFLIKTEGNTLTNTTIVFSSEAQTIPDKKLIEVLKETIDKWEKGIIAAQGYTKIMK